MKAFIIWAICGLIIIGIGIGDLFSKKVVGFWANVKTSDASDIKKYNCAVGKLLIVYGVVYIALGLPLLCGQNSPYILLSVLGVFIETIVVMIVYSVVITNKYKVK